MIFISYSNNINDTCTAQSNKFLDYEQKYKPASWPFVEVCVCWAAARLSVGCCGPHSKHGPAGLVSFPTQVAAAADAPK